MGGQIAIQTNTADYQNITKYTLIKKDNLSF